MAIESDSAKASPGADREVRSGAPLLSARDIHFRFQKRDILKGINFSLCAGEIVSLLGANGAGKTTLLRVLLGLVAPAKGQVLIGETPLVSLPRRQIARTLAYVPQVHATPFPYTVREVVTMGRLPQKNLVAGSSVHDHEVVRRVLVQLKIWHLADRVYSEISGGERQLTLIARALAQEAPILILDEPLANLDFGYQAVLGQHLRNLADNGHTILMSSHDPQFAYHASSRIAVLIEGRVAQDGAPREVLSAETMRRIYGVQIECIALSNSRTVFFPTAQSSAGA